MCIEAALANWLTGAGAAVGAASAIGQGRAAASAYSAQAANDDQNAKIAAKQAEQAALAGAREEREMRQRGAAAMGTQRAAFSANGLDIGSGSPLDVLNDTQYLNELDALTIRQNTANDVWGHQVQSVNYINQAKANRAAARNSRRAGNLGAFGSLLTGAAGIAKNNMALKAKG